MGTPYPIQKVEELFGEHGILRDEHLKDEIREGVLLSWHPFHNIGDLVPQAKPKELPRQLVDDGL